MSKLRFQIAVDEDSIQAKWLLKQNNMSASISALVAIQAHEMGGCYDMFLYQFFKDKGIKLMEDSDDSAIEAPKIKKKGRPRKNATTSSQNSSVNTADKDIKNIAQKNIEQEEDKNKTVSVETEIIETVNENNVDAVEITEQIQEPKTNEQVKETEPIYKIPNSRKNLSNFM